MKDMKDKNTLIDFQGVPVVNIQEPFGFTKRYEIFRGADSQQQLLTLTFTMKLELVFQNHTDGQLIQMGLKGEFAI
jgi:hypothetical protein